MSDEALHALSIDKIEEYIVGALDTVYKVCNVEHYDCEKKKAINHVIFHIDKKKLSEPVTIIPGYAAYAFPQVITVHLNKKKVKKVCGFFQSPLPSSSSGELFPQKEIQLHTSGSLMDFLYLHLCVPITIIRSLDYNLYCFKDIIDSGKCISIEPLFSSTDKGSKKGEKIIFKIINNNNKKYSIVEILPDFTMKFSSLSSDTAAPSSDAAASTSTKKKREITDGHVATTDSAFPFSTSKREKVAFLIPPAIDKNSHVSICATTGAPFHKKNEDGGEKDEYFIEHTFLHHHHTSASTTTAIPHPLTLQGQKLMLQDII